MKVEKDYKKRLNELNMRKYDITIDGDNLRYGKTYVYANNIQDAIKKAQRLYPKGKKVSVSNDYDED